MSMTHPFPIGTRVAFDIEDLVVGTGVVAEADHGTDWTYRLDSIVLTTGNPALLTDLAVEGDGGVWVCEHEVQALPVGPLAEEVPA